MLGQRRVSSTTDVDRAAPLVRVARKLTFASLTRVREGLVARRAAASECVGDQDGSASSANLCEVPLERGVLETRCCHSEPSAHVGLIAAPCGLIDGRILIGTADPDVKGVAIVRWFAIRRGVDWPRLGPAAATSSDLELGRPVRGPRHLGRPERFRRTVPVVRRWALASGARHNNGGQHEGNGRLRRAWPSSWAYSRVGLQLVDQMLEDEMLQGGSARGAGSNRPLSRPRGTRESPGATPRAEPLSPAERGPLGSNALCDHLRTVRGLPGVVVEPTRQARARQNGSCSVNIAAGPLDRPPGTNPVTGPWHRLGPGPSGNAEACTEVAHRPRSPPATWGVQRRLQEDVRTRRPSCSAGPSGAQLPHSRFNMGRSMAPELSRPGVCALPKSSVLAIKDGELTYGSQNYADCPF